MPKNILPCSYTVYVSLHAPSTENRFPQTYFPGFRHKTVSQSLKSPRDSELSSTTQCMLSVVKANRYKLAQR